MKRRVVEIFTEFLYKWFLRFGELSSDVEMTVCKNQSAILHYVQLFETYVGQ